MRRIHHIISESVDMQGDFGETFLYGSEKRGKSISFE
jgi:hypothetical protein